MLWGNKEPWEHLVLSVEIDRLCRHDFWQVDQKTKWSYFFLVEIRWRKRDHSCWIIMLGLARDENFYQFTKCNQCHGNLHNKYLKLIHFLSMKQNQKEMVTVGQKKCYMMAAEAKHSPCETSEKIICNQEMRSSLCLQNNLYKSPTGKCKAQPEVTQLCTQLPDCEKPSEHETTCIARYWNAKKFTRNLKGSQSASVFLCISLSCRKSWGWDEDLITKSFSRSQEISHSCPELTSPLTSMQRLS